MKKKLMSLSLFCAFFVMLLFPEPVKQGALEGLSLWYNSVIPILFPFMILSNIMMSTNSLNLFFKPIFILAKNFSGFNPWLLYPLFFGLFCGFPMGAKTIADLISSGRLSRKEGAFLLPIVSQASPMFLAGYVGVHILKKTISLPRILFYLYFPPLTLFAVFFLISAFLKKGTYNSKNSMFRNTEHTIWNAFTVIVMIGIYMMLFTIAANLCRVLLPENRILTFFLCSLEFSTGLNRLNQLSYLAPALKTGLILALTSFGGFCTTAQVYSMVKDTGITLKSYLSVKILLALAVFILYASSVSS